MRETTIPAGTNPIHITIIRTEPQILTLPGHEAATLAMTISDTPQGVVMVEVPGPAGVFLLHPGLLQIMPPNVTYHVQFWVVAASSRQLLASGRLDITERTTPAGTDAATVFLAGFGQVGGPSRLVVLTQADWEALATTDENTIYLVLEDVV